VVTGRAARPIDRYACAIGGDQAVEAIIMLPHLPHIGFAALHYCVVMVARMALVIASAGRELCNHCRAATLHCWQRDQASGEKYSPRRPHSLRRIDAGGGAKRVIVARHRHRHALQRVRRHRRSRPAGGLN
jgi:hypothetical protein